MWFAKFENKSVLVIGQEKGEELLSEYMGSEYVAVKLLKEIIMLDDKSAKLKLIEKGLTEERSNEVLTLTHCNDLIDNYYITSQDMVGKSGVWGHFGSWDFDKAAMYNQVRTLEYNDGVSILSNEFGLSDDLADRYFYEIKNQDPDRWISPWPGYASGVSSCSKTDNLVKCGNGLEVNLDTFDAFVYPQQGKSRIKSLAYIDNNNEYQLKEFDPEVNFGAILIPNGNSFNSVLTSPEQTGSMFSRLYFLGGHGLKHFQPFSRTRTFNGLNIYTYKIDFQGGEKVIDENLLPPLELSAQHILLKSSDNESLKRITEIRNLALTSDFGDLATKYSQGPTNATKGELGWFSKGMMVKPFEEAAYALEIGEISEPVLTQFGYHIIKINAKRRGSVEENGFK